MVVRRSAEHCVENMHLIFTRTHMKRVEIFCYRPKNGNHSVYLSPNGRRFDVDMRVVSDSTRDNPTRKPKFIGIIWIEHENWIAVYLLPFNQFFSPFDLIGFGICSSCIGKSGCRYFRCGRMTSSSLSGSRVVLHALRNIISIQKYSNWDSLRPANSSIELSWFEYSSFFALHIRSWFFSLFHDSQAIIVSLHKIRFWHFNLDYYSYRPARLSFQPGCFGILCGDSEIEFSIRSSSEV